MSYREHWEIVRSSVINGDVISGCRDNDTHTYRLFVNKGWRNVKLGHTTGIPPGISFDACECVDLSFEDLKVLLAVIQKAVDGHGPWPAHEENDDDLLEIEP